LRRLGVAAAFAFGLSTLWALTHHYRGLRVDGELYAFQAFARLRPWLSADLYLKYGSQDRYTLFSPIYAKFIELFGLRLGGQLLFLACLGGLLTGAWSLIRRLSTAHEAWFAVTLLILTAGTYGVGNIFSYTESYVTARSMGEALAVIALAVHLGGRRPAALVIGLVALCVHPLMALPGLLLLICLWLPVRVAVMSAAAGVLAIFAFALMAATVPLPWSFATVVDASWLDMARERSQFLFLRYWGSGDWESAVRPFVCLTLTALVVPDPRTRKLASSAMLVGASGMAVAAIAGAVGPIAILLQGQAWRWIWLTTFVSVVLLALTVVRMWRADPSGPLCSLLLLVGWISLVVDSLACVEAALFIWLMRGYIPRNSASRLNWLAAAVGAVLLIWELATAWTSLRAPLGDTGHEPMLISRLRQAFGLEFTGILLAWLVWHWVRTLRSSLAIYGLGLVFLGAAAWILPVSMSPIDSVGTPAEVRDFADWRAAIPPTSNVLFVPGGASAGFIWFTLERPSYLTANQSAGVVFSPETAAEVRRRGEILLPLGKPDWQFLTANLSKQARTSAPAEQSSTKAAVADKNPLTHEILMHICGDPQLGFVIAQENVGFDALRHSKAGKYKDWYLYDCHSVRAGLPRA
jgi:hypothetical protein